MFEVVTLTNYNEQPNYQSLEHRVPNKNKRVNEGKVELVYACASKRINRTNRCYNGMYRRSAQQIDPVYCIQSSNKNMFYIPTTNQSMGTN